MFASKVIAYQSGVHYFKGKILALPTKIRSCWKVIVMAKHSSLFSVDEERKLFDIVT
jgi:hypothetical protein